MASIYESLLDSLAKIPGPPIEAQLLIRARSESNNLANYGSGNLELEKGEESQKLKRRYENLTSYADDAVKGFRQFYRDGPVALSKLGPYEVGFFVNNHKAYTDTRESIVWGYLGAAELDSQKAGWLSKIDDIEFYWRSKIVCGMHVGGPKSLFNHLLASEKATENEANLKPSSRNSLNFF
ncbi:MAG: hypothetical protein Q9169_006314 [Polycauliona sp. 2 TL-2023]